MNMKREIYEVHLAYINAAGYHASDPNVGGTQYPVVIDSKTHDNNVEETLKLAMGRLGAAESFLSQQDHQVSYCYIIRVSDGMQIEKRKFGKIEDVVVPDPTYSVTVENGTGSGAYAAGASVTIAADAPAAGKVFDKWTGADNLSFISGSASTANASFRMPAEAVTMTATYIDAE